MFRQPLYLLWMIPALVAAGALAWRAARQRSLVTKSLGTSKTLARLIPAESAARRTARAWLRGAALALVFAALAGPQWGVELVATRSSARQVIALVDVSSSMTAEDIKPSRLAKAKSELALLLDALKGERVGIIAFAGQPGTLCPLTVDIDGAKQVLRALEVGAVPEPGTAIGAALREATAQLARASGGKAVVLITDGEDHRTDPLGAAREAAAAGIRVFAIGIGTPEGEPLPVKDPGTGELTGYKKNSSGGTVISRLGEETLSSIASQTGGAYFRSTPGEEEVAQVLHAITAMEKSGGTAGTANRYKNWFVFPLAAALLLLLLEVLLPLTARRAAVLAMLLPLLSPGDAAAAGREKTLRQGNSLYEKGDYQGALQRYEEGATQGDERARFNRGNARYRLEEYKKSQEDFETLTSSAASREMRAAAYYNQGDALMKQERPTEAVEAFRRAVTLDPSDPEARHNLAVALKKQEQKKSKKKDDKENKDKKDPKKDAPPKPQDGSQSAPPPKSRPQDQLSREDAERLLRAVKEKEKAPGTPKPRPTGAQKPPSQEDW